MVRCRVWGTLAETIDADKGLVMLDLRHGPTGTAARCSHLTVVGTGIVFYGGVSVACPGAHQEELP
jgi:hypothetical protein